MKNLIVVTLICGALAGCNTVAGVGEDITDGATAVQGWL